MKKFCVVFLLVVFSSSFVFAGQCRRGGRRVTGAQGRGVGYVRAEGIAKRFVLEYFKKLQSVYTCATSSFEGRDGLVEAFNDLLSEVVADFNKGWGVEKFHSYRQLKKKFFDHFVDELSNCLGVMYMINFTESYCFSFLCWCVAIDEQLNVVCLGLDDQTKIGRLDKIRRLNDMLYSAIKGVVNFKGFDLVLDVSSIEQRLQDKRRLATNQFGLLDGYESDSDGESLDLCI
mgnify:CR=1 FL=1